MSFSHAISNYTLLCYNFTGIYLFSGCICSNIPRLIPFIHLPRDFLILPAERNSTVSLSPPSSTHLQPFTPSSPLQTRPVPSPLPTTAVHPVLTAAQPDPPSPAPPLPVLLCQLFSSGLLTKQGIHIGKMPPKIWPVVTVIIESGVAFPTKCHCCSASPHYRAGQIDHLYDARVVTEPHVDTQTLRGCFPHVHL